MWTVDEGLQTLIDQWKRAHPGAVVYTIADENHNSDSEHSPEKQGSEPGADAGEVDAGDFMPGHGVSDADLVDLRRQLIDSRDSRLLYLIKGQIIVSSVVQPWKDRPYGGAYHSHLHVSVNDRYAANRAAWDIEGGEPVPYVRKPITGTMPVLHVGDEDGSGPKWIMRMQRVLKVDDDGVFGPQTATAVKAWMGSDPARSSSNGGTVDIPEWKSILGVW